jgi:hypothetical protein
VDVYSIYRETRSSDSQGARGTMRDGTPTKTTRNAAPLRSTKEGTAQKR